MSFSKLMTLIFISIIPLFSFSQQIKREYLKDRIHDISREKPVKVNSTGIYSVPAPSDAIVLFDGNDINAWKGNFKVLKNKTMVAQKGGLTSKQSFRDVQLHLEWKVNDSLKVKGQSGANSGVYLMGLYEIQILESFKNETYPDGQAGAIYGQFPPLVNASNPQGTWNSYDVIFKAPVYEKSEVIQKAKASVLHNGILIQDSQEFEGPTKYKKITSYPKTHPDKAPIFLQYHGDPIEYRNIWVRELNVKKE